MYINNCLILKTLLLSVLWGFILGLPMAFVRLAGHFFKGRDFFLALIDLFYFIIYTSAYAAFIMRFNGGIVRLYLLFGFMLGTAIYRGSAMKYTYRCLKSMADLTESLYIKLKKGLSCIFSFKSNKNR